MAVGQMMILSLLSTRKSAIRRQVEVPSLPIQADIFGQVSVEVLPPELYTILLTAQEKPQICHKNLPSSALKELSAFRQSLGQPNNQLIGQFYGSVSPTNPKLITFDASDQATKKVT
jgi:hypothetical protein